MEIVNIKINKLKPYEKNAKTHPKENIEAIKKSIQKYGFADPIGVWGKQNIIVEGHGRYLACKDLGIDEVPCIRLDHLTDEERREYTLLHNKTTMMSDFDLDLLGDELADLDLSDFDLDWFEADEETSTGTGESSEDNPYTMKVDIPQYQIKGDCPNISELVNVDKQKELELEINNSNISKEQREFLLNASQRHLCFDYSKIAEYYAHQNKEMQELMEKSALVIIDLDDAIKNGYTSLKKEIAGFVEDDEE